MVPVAALVEPNTMDVTSISNALAGVAAVLRLKAIAPGSLWRRTLENHARPQIHREG